LGYQADCNEGGSYICVSPTRSCPPGTCVGTSTTHESIEVQVSLPPEKLQELQAELMQVVEKFAARQK
jgi:hypothetical protein